MILQLSLAWFLSIAAAGVPKQSPIQELCSLGETSQVSGNETQNFDDFVSQNIRTSCLRQLSL